MFTNNFNIPIGRNGDGHLKSQTYATHFHISVCLFVLEAYSLSDSMLVGPTKDLPRGSSQDCHTSHKEDVHTGVLFWLQFAAKQIMILIMVLYPSMFLNGYRLSLSYNIANRLLNPPLNSQLAISYAVTDIHEHNTKLNLQGHDLCSKYNEDN